MAISKFTPPAVPNDASPTLRAWLDEQMRRLQVLVNDAPLASEDETISGDWTFTGGLTIPEATVTDHEAALTILETQITDGALLARLAANETITGDWSFQDQIAIIDSTGADSFTIQHTGSNVVADSVGTSFFFFTGLAGGVVIADGASLRIRDAGNTDWADFSHDGTDFNLAFTNTTDWNITGANVVLDGTLSIPNGEIQSGTYTPTLTNSTNVAASTAFQCQWMRVGSVVTVSGQVNIDPTAAATQTVLLMSLPIAAVFSSNASCGGSAGSFSRGEIAAIRGATATNEARFDWFPTSTDNTGFPFSFTYEI